MSENTSNHYNLPEDFECPISAPETTCGAYTDELLKGEGEIHCGVCNVFLFTNLHLDEDEVVEIEADSDDEESDYVDDVTVSESEIDIDSTPEEERASRAMKGLDVIKNRLRADESIVLQNLGDFIQEYRFKIQMTYILVQESKKFFTGNLPPMPERMFIVTVAYCKYIDPYEIPDEAYEALTFNKNKIEKIATRFFEEYAGKEQPRIITWMKTYGRSFKYTPDVIKMAVDLWDAADPVYVVAEDQVRAVVWLELTKHKLDKTKINMAALARATGFDSRVISRVVKKYKVYFE